MRDRVWRLIERRLRRSVPAVHLASVIGDLEEDYARRRASRGAARAWLWLIVEVRSLATAYRGPRARLMLLDDVRHAWRRVAVRPAAAIVCASLLALGTGLSTAMFSVVDSLLLQPAPFRDPDRLVQQGLVQTEPAVMDGWRSTGLFDAVEAARAAVFQPDEADGRGWPGALVTPGVFEMLGVRPLRGRLFDAVDGRARAMDEVLLSETIWRSAFGGDPALLGRRIRPRWRGRDRRRHHAGQFSLSGAHDDRLAAARSGGGRSRDRDRRSAEDRRPSRRRRNPDGRDCPAARPAASQLPRRASP